jgi:hypothetical protein
LVADHHDIHPHTNPTPILDRISPSVSIRGTIARHNMSSKGFPGMPMQPVKDDIDTTCVTPPVPEHTQ